MESQGLSEAEMNMNVTPMSSENNIAKHTPNTVSDFLKAFPKSFSENFSPQACLTYAVPTTLTSARNELMIKIGIFDRVGKQPSQLYKAIHLTGARYTQAP